MTKVNPFKEIDNLSIKYPECLEYLNSCSKLEIMQNVREVLIYTERTHKYSMSRLYALWNFLFDRNETPQTCSSCLIRKSQDLRTWLAKEIKVYESLSAQEREEYSKSPNANKDAVGNYESKLDITTKSGNKTARGKRKEA